MKNFYPIHVVDLRFRVDFITPKKKQIFEDFSEDPDNERCFVILITHRQTEMISDCNKILEVKVIQIIRYENKKFFEIYRKNIF